MDRVSMFQASFGQLVEVGYQDDNQDLYGPYDHGYTGQRFCRMEFTNGVLFFVVRDPGLGVFRPFPSEHFALMRDGGSEGDGE